MSAESILFDRMSQFADIVEVMGSVPEIYAVSLPQGEHQSAVGPLAISYFRVTDIDRYYSFGERCQVVRAMFQVSAWGPTPEDARDLARRIRNALDAYSSGSVQRVSVRRQRELPEPDVTNGPIYQVAIDLDVVHNEET